MKQLGLVRKLLSVCTLMLLALSHAYPQTASTQGRDFWFAFMNNNSTNPTETCLILSAEHACTFTVSNPNTGWSTSGSIPANGRVDVVIPFAQAYHSGSDNAVYSLGCHLVATDVISAYSMNYKNASFDGANLLPTETLADNYMIETIPPGLNGSSVLIIGTENGTVVDITPAAATNGGWAAGSTHSITLNAGQVYQFSTSGADVSLSGTVIQTQDCKRVAVFAGGKCAQAPAGCTYCDHIYEPMIPTIYWGNHFAVTSSLTRNNDIIRVTALNSNTVVTKNGATVATLAAGGTYNFQLNSSEGSCYIETSGPAACYLYLTGQSCGGGNGDPSMVYITPVEQNIKKITFGTYYNSGTSTLQQYVNVVTSTSNVSSVTLDGSNISSYFTPLAGNANYSYARLQITHATHTLQCDSGLMAHVYGLGNVTSYAYNVGSNAIDLTSAIFINDINVADIPEDQTYCPDLEINFEVELNYSYDNITWDFGDGSTGVGNPVPHTYGSPGTYFVTALVERLSSNCFGSTVDTLRGRVNIPPAEPVVINEVLCGGGSYDYHGNVLSQPGIYFDTLVSVYGCDSITELHLSLVPTDPVEVNASICQGNSYDFFGQILSEAGVYVDTIATMLGCDSIVELHLSVFPTDPVVLDTNICPGDSYTFNGHPISEPGVYLDTLTSSGGCDSISELHLSYAPVPTVSAGEDQVLCGPEQFPASVSASASGDLNYQWNTGATTPSMEVSQAGTYTVTVTNQYGCTGSDAMEIQLKDPITVSIDALDDICVKGSAVLVATTNAPALEWNTGETVSAIEVSHIGTYSVRAYDGPCEETADIELPECPPDLIFPNIITPNGDGSNDVFAIGNLDIDFPNYIAIYNRWGKKVFEKENYQTFARDGAIHNAESGFSAEGLSDGVYYYSFHYEGRVHKLDYHGTITVIRDR